MITPPYPSQLRRRMTLKKLGSHAALPRASMAKTFAVAAIVACASMATYCYNGRCYSSHSHRSTGSAAHHGGTCFAGMARISLFDGSDVPISGIKTGDVVVGYTGDDGFQRPLPITVKQLVKYTGPYEIWPMRTEQNARSKPFVTKNHPLLTDKGWYSIDNITSEGFDVSALKLFGGSMLRVHNGHQQALLPPHKYDSIVEQDVYHILLDTKNRTIAAYVVNGFIFLE